MNTAEVAGNLSDTSGARIVGARVTAVSSATGESFATSSDRDGHFVLAQLPVGEFTLSTESKGFKRGVRQHLVLRINDHDREDIVLQVGAPNESVVVESGTTNFESASAAVKDVIEEHQVVDLPLKARQMLQLTLLSEGVVNPPGGTRGDSLQQTGALINVLGQRTGHNLFLVNGTSITDEYYNNVVINPSPDSIREFLINKTSYEAQFGSKSGAVVNVLTNSGGHELHGSLFEFLRNDAVDAENYFALKTAPIPVYNENQFGAALGGPVVQNRIFAFVNYEGLRLHQDLAHLFSVPTAQQRQGLLGTASVIGPFNSAALALLDPVNTPLPNLSGPSNNLLEESPMRLHTDQYALRLDMTPSRRDAVFLYGTIFDAHESDPYGSPALNEAQLPAFGRTLRTHTLDLSAGETHSLSQSAFNDLRFGWLRVSGGQVDPNARNPFAASNGILGTTANPLDQGFGQFNLSGQFTTIGSPAGFTSRVDNHFDLFDDVTVQRSRHTLQFGAYLFHLKFQPRYPNNARGVYTFNGSYTGTALGDFLKGQPSSAQVGLGDGSETATTDWLHVYGQDRWAVTQRLDLTVGLRYEYNRNLSAGQNQTSDITLDPSIGPAFVVSGDTSALSPTAMLNASLSPIPIISSGQAGWDPSLLTPRRLRLSPRIGLVWSPGDGGLMVRAAYGIYTNQASYSVLQNLAENIPFFFTETVTAPATANTSYSTQNILSSANYKVGTVGANSVDHNFRVEYNEVYNVSLEKAASFHSLLGIEYVGSRTIHADSSTLVNMPVLPPTGTTTSAASRRPFPQLSAFNTIRWNGWANFNSVTARGSRRFSHGLYFLATYTFSKSLDDASDTGTTNNEYNLPQNEYAPQQEGALSSFDHRHRVSATAVYDLPFAASANGLVRAAFGGWRSSGIFIVQSGAPFTVNLSTAAGNEPADVGLANASTNVERPNVSRTPNGGARTATQWFDTGAFSLPALYTYGDAGRNITLGPRFASLDLSLQKEFATIREQKLQLRLDAFNVLNHANLNLPGRIASFNSAGVQTSPTFGAITSAQDPREFQVGLKYLF